MFRFVQICLELSGLFQIRTGLIRFSLDQSRSVQNFGVGWGGGLLVLLDGGQVEQEEAQFSGGGDRLSVLGGIGLGLGQAVELVGEAVGGDGPEDVVAVEAEVSEVGVDGGRGAAHLPGDLAQGECLAVEVVGFDHASAASGGRWFRDCWVGHGRAFPARIGTCVLCIVLVGRVGGDPLCHCVTSPPLRGGENWVGVWGGCSTGRGTLTLALSQREREPEGEGIGGGTGAGCCD